MKQRTLSFLLGFALGALTIAMGRRLKEVVGDEDTASLVDRISDRLEALESRTKSEA